MEASALQPGLVVAPGVLQELLKEDATPTTFVVHRLHQSLLLDEYVPLALSQEGVAGVQGNAPETQAHSQGFLHDALGETVLTEPKALLLTDGASECTPSDATDRSQSSTPASSAEEEESDDADASATQLSATWRASWETLSRAEWMHRLATARSTASVPPTAPAEVTLQLDPQATALVTTGPPATQRSSAGALPALRALRDMALAGKLRLHALCELDVWVQVGEGAGGALPDLRGRQPPPPAAADCALSLTPLPSRGSAQPSASMASCAGEVLACVAAACTRSDVTYFVHKAAGSGSLTIVAAAEVVQEHPHSMTDLTEQGGPSKSFALWQVAQLSLVSHTLQTSSAAPVERLLSGPRPARAPLMRPPAQYAARLALLCQRSADKVWKGVSAVQDGSGHFQYDFKGAGEDAAALLHDMYARAVHLAGMGPRELLRRSASGSVPTWVHTTYARLALLAAASRATVFNVCVEGPLESAQQAATSGAARSSPKQPGPLKVATGPLPDALLQAEAALLCGEWSGWEAFPALSPLTTVNSALAAVEGPLLQRVLMPAGLGSSQTDGGGGCATATLRPCEEQPSTLLVEEEAAVDRLCDALGFALLHLLLSSQRLAPAPPTRQDMELTVEAHAMVVAAATATARACLALGLFADARAAARIACLLMPSQAALGIVQHTDVVFAGDVAACAARWAVLRAQLVGVLASSARLALAGAGGQQVGPRLVPAWLCAPRVVTALEGALLRLRSVPTQSEQSAVLLGPLLSCDACQTQSQQWALMQDMLQPSAPPPDCQALRMWMVGEAARLGTVFKACGWGAHGPEALRASVAELTGLGHVVSATLMHSTGRFSQSQGFATFLAQQVAPIAQDWAEVLRLWCAAIGYLAVGGPREPPLTPLHTAAATALQHQLADACLRAASLPSWGGQPGAPTAAQVPTHPAAASMASWPIPERMDLELLTHLPSAADTAQLSTTIAAAASQALRGGHLAPQLTAAGARDSLVFLDLPFLTRHAAVIGEGTLPSVLAALLHQRCAVAVSLSGMVAKETAPAARVTLATQCSEVWEAAADAAVHLVQSGARHPAHHSALWQLFTASATSGQPPAFLRRVLAVCGGGGQAPPAFASQPAQVQAAVVLLSGAEQRLLPGARGSLLMWACRVLAKGEGIEHVHSLAKAAFRGLLQLRVGGSSVSGGTLPDAVLNLRAALLP